MRLRSVFVFILALGVISQKCVGVPLHERLTHAVREKEARANAPIYLTLQKNAGFVVRPGLMGGIKPSDRGNSGYQRFLDSIGTRIEKSVTADVAKELIEKSAEPKFILLEKDAGAIFRKARMEAGVAEGALMKAFGMDPANPQDVTNYSDFEASKSQLQITPDVLKAAAKVVKVDPFVLAADVIASEQSHSAAPPTTTTGSGSGSGSGAGAGGSGSGGDAAAFGKSAEGTLLSRIAGKLEKSEVDELNGLLLKSQQAKGGGGGTVVTIQKSAEDTKLEKRAKVGADILGLKDRENNSLEKTGIIVETDFSPAGTNNPTLGTNLFEIASPQMAILKDVQTVVMTSNHQEVLVVGKNVRTGMKLTAGTDPTSGQLTNFINSSKIMDATDLDWAMSIKDQTALQYQGNLPGLDNTVSDMFTAQLATEPEDLGLNGTTDTYDGSTFTTIRKGWYKQAVDLATGGAAWRLIDLSNGIGAGSITTIMGAMDAILAVHRTNNAVGLTPDHTFVMSPGDWGRYENEYIADRKADDVLVSGAPKTYRSYAIRVSPFAQDSKIVFTWLKNLIFGYVNAPQQGLRVEREHRNKALRIIVSLGVAYSIVDPNSMVVTQA